MEIKDQLGVIWRKLWIVILVPLVAGAIVGAMSLRGPTEYRATATVAVPGVVSGSDAQYGGTNGNRSFVSNYAAVVLSLSTAQQVAAMASVPVADVRDGLRFAQVGDSSLVRVTYRTKHKADAAKVANAAANMALGFVFRPGVESARETLDVAKSAADDAQGAIDGFVAETGLADPERTYQVKAQAVSSLEEQAITSQAAGGSSGAVSVITAALGTAKKELASMTPLITQYRALVEVKDRAVTHLDQSENQLVSASTSDEIVRFQQVVKEAKEAVTEAQAPINTFISRTGLIDPEQSYQMKQQQISTLEQQIVTSQIRTTGSTAQPEVIAAAVATARQELAAMTPLLARYKTLVEERDRTKTPLAEAEKALEAATARFEASDTGSAVSLSSTTQVAYVKAAAMKAGAAAAGALFLVILALFALNSGLQRPDGPAQAGQSTAMALGR
jgi:hypothetical protein